MCFLHSGLVAVVLSNNSGSKMPRFSLYLFDCTEDGLFFLIHLMTQTLQSTIPTSHQLVVHMPLHLCSCKYKLEVMFTHQTFSG